MVIHRSGQPWNHSRHVLPVSTSWTEWRDRGSEEFWIIVTALRSGDAIEDAAAFEGSGMPRRLQEGVALMPLKYFRALLAW